MEIIYFPKLISNTFCHFSKITILTTNTILLELNFLPQLLLVLSYLQ